MHEAILQVLIDGILELFVLVIGALMGYVTVTRTSLDRALSMAVAGGGLLIVVWFSVRGVPIADYGGVSFVGSFFVGKWWRLRSFGGGDEDGWGGGGGDDDPPPEDPPEPPEFSIEWEAPQRELVAVS